MKLHRALTVACVTGFLGLAYGCQKETVRVEPPPPKVSVAHPEVRELVDYDQYNGKLEAAKSVDLRARVRGHIKKIHFTDGQLVKKGDLLIELDPRPFEADIARQKDQKEIYEAQLVAAQKEEKRLKDLQGRGGASLSQVEKAEADTKTLEAQIKANDQEIIRKSLDLEYSKLTAEMDGRIGRALLSEGNLVNAGGAETLLATIVSVEPVYAYFAVDERALQRYQKDRAGKEGGGRAANLKELQIKVKLGLDTDEGYPYEGTLDFADNQIDKSTGTIQARAVITEKVGMLTPGSKVRVRIPTSAAHQVLLVPDTAILSDQDKKYVLLLDDKNIVQRRDVSTGRLLDDGMRILTPGGKGKDLSAKDWIIVLGLQMARINYPVEPVKPATQPAPAVSSAK